MFAKLSSWIVGMLIESILVAVDHAYILSFIFVSLVA